MKMRSALSLSAALLALAAAPAVHADTMISGHAGKAFGGDLNDSRTTWGGALTFMGNGPFGFEIEGGYTPDFFGDPSLVGNNNVSTLMANVLLGVHFGTTHPGTVYVSGGGGLLKTRVSSVDEFFNVDNTDWGVSGGIGAMGFFTDHIGLRGDARYFRNLGNTDTNNPLDINLGDFRFWRGTGGIVLRF
jgi:outer membrane protein with beta-barrel domain